MYPNTTRLRFPLHWEHPRHIGGVIVKGIDNQPRVGSVLIQGDTIARHSLHCWRELEHITSCVIFFSFAFLHPHILSSQSPN